MSFAVFKCVCVCVRRGCGWVVLFCVYIFCRLFELRGSTLSPLRPLLSHSLHVRSSIPVADIYCSLCIHSSFTGKVIEQQHKRKRRGIYTHTHASHTRENTVWQSGRAMTFSLSSAQGSARSCFTSGLHYRSVHRCFEGGALWTQPVRTKEAKHEILFLCGRPRRVGAYPRTSLSCVGLVHCSSVSLCVLALT